MGVVPRLKTHEERYVEMARRLYGAVWPDTRWRVDVSAYANFAAGYTTADGHIVIYSTDAGNQDLYAVETIFHEVQHASVVAGTIRGTLADTFKATGAGDVPDNLWHALIFATAGEFVRTLTASEKLPAYTPYWIKEGFEQRDGWRTLVPAVNAHWLPIVRGEVASEQGLTALARALRSR